MHATQKVEVAELLFAHQSEVVELIIALKTELADRLDGSETRVRQDVLDALADAITDKVFEERGVQETM